MTLVKRIIVGLLAFSLLNTGCYDSRRIRTDELHKLDGYRSRDYGILKSTSDLVQGKRAKPNPVMRDIKGRPVEFSEDTDLIFWLCCGARGARFEDSYRAVNVDAKAFRGVSNHGRKVGYPLNQIRYVEVEEFDGTKTVIAVGGISLITLTVLSVIVLAAGGGGSSGGDDWWDD